MHSRWQNRPQGKRVDKRQACTAGSTFRAAKLLRLAWFLPFVLLACQVNQPGTQPPADYAPHPLWEAIWQGNQPAVTELSMAAAWQATGSIEGERYRQAELIAQGRRAELLIEAEQRMQAEPFQPDLAYLHARLLQDPERLAARFTQLAQIYPHHAWIRLGAAGAELQRGKLAAARAHLQAAPDWPDARDFRELVSARLREASGESQPWRSLLESAFLRGSPTALSELEGMARRAGHASLSEFAAVDRALRRIPPARSALVPGSDAEADALELLLRRLRAQLAFQPQLGLPEVLAQLDGWSERLGLPAVWGITPRYRLPFGAGILLRPEHDAGPLSELLARHERVVLLGWSWLQGSRVVELAGVTRVKTPWRGSSRGIEVVLADEALGNTGWISGGAVFRGFYVRRDLSRRVAFSLARQLERLQATQLPEAWQDQSGAAVTQTDIELALPEDFDLALRIRAKLTGGDLDAVLQCEWQALVLHEAGHLPDVLPWAQEQGLHWLPQLGRALGSWMQDGWPLSEWEYRAQLRALATGLQAEWHLAQIVETARDPSQPYYRPYRRLLRDLVAEARVRQLPALAAWNELSRQELTELARALARKQSISLLDAASAQQLLEAVGRLEMQESG